MEHCFLLVYDGSGVLIFAISFRGDSAPHPVTKDKRSETASLRALLAKTADAQVLAQMLGFVADRLMALDVEPLCGASAHERSAERVNHRDGYRARTWETRAGTVDVRIPKLRKGAYFPDFLDLRRAVEKAMTAVIQSKFTHR
jgi:transposase-like protein